MKKDVKLFLVTGYAIHYKCMRIIKILYDCVEIQIMQFHSHIFYEKFFNLLSLRFMKTTDRLHSVIVYIKIGHKYV